MAKRSPGLEQAGQLIHRSMSALGEQTDRLYRTHYALGHLPDLIGNAFAEHIHPIGVRHKKLFLHIPEDSWRSEVWMFRDEIINRINQCAGEEIVDEIVSTYRRDLEVLENAEPNHVNESRVNPKKELLGVNLTDDELEELRGDCSCVQDEELRKRLFSVSIKRKKLEKLRVQKDWHPCSGCGVMCPPEKEYCRLCSSRKRADIRKKIRSILSELPWLRYNEIKEDVPCTPDVVESVRNEMIQRLASKVRLEDYESLDAHIIVMLYLHIQPEYLTDEIVRKTLYRLRNDLVKPREFKPMKRYDVVPLGKRTGRRRKVNVSSSGE